MVSKKIDESIIEAKEALDNVETLGKTAFDVCDGILSNNKAFIHKKELYDEIVAKEKQVYEEYQRKMIDARAKLKNVDPLYQWDEGLNFYMKIRRWKSMEMLSFWDKMSKRDGI